MYFTEQNKRISAKFLFGRSAGETNYGLLQMTWTTNVPALPILPETRGVAMVPEDIMQPWEHGALPRLIQPGLWTQQNASVRFWSILFKFNDNNDNDRFQSAVA